MNDTIIGDPPLDLMAELLAREYGLTGEISRLAGENHNYCVITHDGVRLVLKLAGDDQTSETFDLEHQAIERALANDVGFSLPRFFATGSDAIEAFQEVPGGEPLHARLVEFVSGTPWCDAGVATPLQRRDLGRALGVLDRALDDLKHPAAERTHRWDLTAVSRHRSKVQLIADGSRRRILEWSFHFYAACALPRLADLPHSIIHADANDENVLVENQHVAGLLDFGDCLYNPTICELAVAATYAMLDPPDPLQAGAEIVAGYHAIRPLLRDELAVLYPLICGRLSATVTVAAERRRIDPDRSSWFVTEDRAWRLLGYLSTLDPADAARQLAAGTELRPAPEAGEPAEALLEKRRHHISKSLSIAYREPLKMVRGSGQYLYDVRGRPFLDLVNNVCHVGHCHPRVVEAGRRQMARLNTNTRYLYDGLTDYAERLCMTLPGLLDTCFFLNSGSEANELALRLATNHTGRKDFLVVDGAYHGNTARLIAASPYKFLGQGGTGRPEPWVHIVPRADGYRGVHKGEGCEAGVAYGDEVGRVIEEAGVPVAGFITESLLSCGGQVIPPKSYLETAFAHVRAAGGLCILDEVQVGFGRVGTHFWAFEMQGVVPDIVVMGKPIGNGHPMAAVVTTQEIAKSFANGMEFFASFGGNPVSCAIGLSVLDVIRDEGLQEHALEVGTRLREGLRRLMVDHTLIGDVRGTGLFIGIELVRDRQTLEPAATEADKLVERMMERGMLLSTDGPLHNVIKIKPPMVLNEDDVDMVVRTFADELAAVGY